MAGFLGGIFSLTIALIFVTNVLLLTVHDTNTSDWSVAEVSLWSTLGIVIVAGVIYAAASLFGMTS